MILLFNGMLISLSMVYDREMGSMRILMVSPLPRWFLFTAKLLAGCVLSVLPAYAFLVIALLWDIVPLWYGYITVLPALILAWLRMGLLALARPAGAAPRWEDPAGPGPQRLVRRRAAGAYWSGRLDNKGDWRGDPEIAALVRRIAPRHVSTEAGLAEIEAFTKTAVAD